jgi:hypothetical protein
VTQGNGIPRPDDSDEVFLARLGILLDQLDADEVDQQLDILPRLRAMHTPRCRTCGGPIIPLQGGQPDDWVHVEAADRAAPHRAAHGPMAGPHRG